MNYPADSAALVDMYTQAYKHAIISQKRVFEEMGIGETPQQHAISRTRNGGFICCEYCGSGWHEDHGRCTACGAPCADALRGYLDILRGEDMAYASAPQVVVGDTNSTYIVDWRSNWATT